MTKFVNYLKTNADSIQSWTDSLSHIAQVLALILAGFWTYKSFWETERPSLEAHLTSTSDISWNKIPNSKGVCEAVLDVTLENIGKRSVDVTQMRIKGWLIDAPRTVGENPVFFPDDEIMKGHPFFDQVFTSAYLIAHYPPGVKIGDSFTWYFKEQPRRSAYWQVTFTTSEALRYDAKSAIGDFVCSYNSE
jgi:hypothetical protein